MNRNRIERLDQGTCPDGEACAAAHGFVRVAKRDLNGRTICRVVAGYCAGVLALFMIGVLIASLFIPRQVPNAVKFIEIAK
jgi:hypothetical protein